MKVGLILSLLVVITFGACCSNSSKIQYADATVPCDIKVKEQAGCVLLEVLCGEDTSIDIAAGIWRTKDLFPKNVWEQRVELKKGQIKVFDLTGDIYKEFSSFSLGGKKKEKADLDISIFAPKGVKIVSYRQEITLRYE